jgi:hypothetical protein
MPENVIVRVFDVVGSPLCVSSADGDLVYAKIHPLLREGKNVTLSFARVETLISAFLNAAIGQLYGEFSEEQIRAQLSVRDMTPEDLDMLKRVVENAKAYFRDPERFKKAVQEVMGDEE